MRIAKKSYCAGCYNNFYNGNNPYDVKECWHFKSARVVKRQKVHINQMPPFTQKPIKTLNCYQEPQYAMINPSKRGTP